MSFIVCVIFDKHVPRNGKSMSKVAIWPRLRLLALKSIQQFEFSENFNAMVLKLGHIGIFDTLFPFLTFFQL